MELLLNLVWGTLAVTAFCALLCIRSSHAVSGRVSCLTRLIALSCGLTLLFPFVSATDDLHASQALAEDAMKRVHQGVASPQQVKQFGNGSLFLSLLTLLLLLALVQSGSWSPQFLVVRPLESQRVPLQGRSPPNR